MSKKHLEKFIGFGVAGNFAHHLEQAGEASDFVDVITQEQDAPKGIFPFYLPNSKTFLGTYPISHSKLTYPKGNENLQMEPEVALVCKIKYKNNIVVDLSISHFTAYNDATIRKDTARKISEKKSWANNSKGISENLIPIDKFDDGGIMDSYYIVSFVKRENKFHMYGENSPLLSYSYFYKKLKLWIIKKLNEQKDFDPLEDLSVQLKECGYPQDMIISIGSTRYTDFGENNYLKINDECFVVVYNKKHYSLSEVEDLIIRGNTLHNNNISMLHQKVVSG